MNCFLKKWFRCFDFLQQDWKSHCRYIVVAIVTICLITKERRYKIYFRNYILKEKKCTMRLNHLSYILFLQNKSIISVSKKSYESESVYASESDFGWSPKVFWDHTYMVSGLGRPSDTIQNLIWYWFRWCWKVFWDHPLHMYGLVKPFETIQNLQLMYKLILNLHVSDSTNYRPQTKLQEGNVLTPVCQSFCSHGGMCIPACIWGRHPPPRQTSPGQKPHPSGQTPPWAGTPPPRRPLLRTVRILLECILVSNS